MILAHAQSHHRCSIPILFFPEREDPCTIALWSVRGLCFNREFLGLLFLSLCFCIFFLSLPLSFLLFRLPSQVSITYGVVVRTPSSSLYQLIRPRSTDTAVTYVWYTTYAHSFVHCKRFILCKTALDTQYD
ncbi:uncharacterized protein BO66DRAFT_217104 [Aspergillus aculeatinus CBS 121060]|uniref:Uncharacterized protein n=1 Tax=Aspergillus aculeatinus CBS 121060 TaxID=1448322 RepID=A0ACD1GUR1_9EURO|nr:hypothetical protein BO66DRAFT_217104 [Aspergillus aculeatinus CBS 121060]RAH65204.1 hypothetical protein BO66DRAFT_217104 [Aspergillus aculeatinus CBS 121060]